MKRLIEGQARAVSVISRLIDENISGRTVILLGERGCGKFTAAAYLAEILLHKSPFLSPDFMFYRNDLFSVKTRYFLNNIKNEKIKSIFSDYLNYFLGRLSAAISLGEIAAIKLKKMFPGTGASYTVNDFRNELPDIINRETFFDLIENPSAFSSNLIIVSDEISKKSRIPIDFIRRAIEFNGIKSESGRKITLIGNFENASEETQNASLKLLEEPPAGNLIIITANSSNTILPTILSRSMIIHFNQLTPALVNGILGSNGIIGSYYSTIELMEDQLYGFHEERKKKVVEFFTSIAPAIQQGNSVFTFIETMVSGQNSRSPVHFFNEMIEFIRNAQLLRQQYLRKTDLSGYIDTDYKKILDPAIHSIYTAELKEFASRIGYLINKIRFNNVTPAAVLPGFLIDMARWYQKSLKKHAR
ncbi:MAG: hypothetical protein ABSG94_01625 [Brevinematales bacterium]|jgi:DNA polymerase III delta prime subunit